MKKGNKIVGGIVVAGVMVVGGVLITLSTHKIKPGYVGVVYNLRGGIQDNILTQGLRIVSPFQKVSQYSVATEQAYLSRDKKEGSLDDDSFMIPTSDGKTVNVDLEFSYHFDSDRLPETFTRFKGQTGKEIEDNFIRGKMKAWTSEVSSTFSVIDIYGEKRSELNSNVLAHVKEKFYEYGIIIDSVNFSRIELDDETAKAIQERINKQQELETAKIEAQKAEIEAERKKVEAQGEADAKIIKAQGEAEAIWNSDFIYQLEDMGMNIDSLGMFPIPETNTIKIYGDYMYAVSNTTDNPDTAKAFLKFIFENNRYANAVNIMSPLKEDKETKEVLEKLGELNIPIITYSDYISKQSMEVARLEDEFLQIKKECGIDAAFVQKFIIEDDIDRLINEINLKWNEQINK